MGVGVGPQVGRTKRRPEQEAATSIKGTRPGPSFPTGVSSKRPARVPGIAYQGIATPPLGRMICPVTKDAASLTR